MEHPSQLLKNVGSRHQRRLLLQLFFEELPTYEEILNGTPKLQPLFRLSEEFKRDKAQLVTLTTRNSKPLVEELRRISNTVSKFTSFQKRGINVDQRVEKILPQWS